MATSTATKRARTRTKRDTKAQVVSNLASGWGVSKAQATRNYDYLVDLATRMLKMLEEFTLPGLVTIRVARRKARVGRNPSTGETINIPAKRVLKARPLGALKTAVLPHL